MLRASLTESGLRGTELLRWECMGVRTVPFTMAAMVIAAMVAVDPGGLSPFGPTRWWLVSTLSLAAGGFALWHATVELDRRSRRLWMVLLILFGLAALTNGDGPIALLGHPVRHLGLVTWCLFALVFVTGQQLARETDRRIVLRGVVVTSVGLGIWTVWEVVIGPPIALGVDSHRLTGPFGSAAMFGAACCLVLPVCAGVALDAREPRPWRAAATFGSATTTIALVGSGTRAAWIGIGLAGVALVVVRRPARHLVLAASAAVVVAVALLAPRLDDIVQRTNGAGSRLDEWAVAARVITDHPLLGAGPEGYRIAAIGAVDANYERDYGRDRVLPDRAHSGPIDVAATGGLLAGLVYVALIGGVVASAARTMRTAGPTTTGLCVAIVAYSLQQLLLFPLAELDSVWWLFAGMLVTVAGQPKTAIVQARWRPVAVAAFMLAPFALVVGVLDVAADRQAERAVSAHDIDEAVVAAGRAVDLRPDDLRYRSIAIEVHRERGTLADIDAALVHGERALDWSPDDPIALDQHATLLLDRATITGLDGDAIAAFDAWGELVVRDPVRARWQVQFGRSAALTGQTEVALLAFSAAAQLRPGDPQIAALLAELERRI